MRTLSALKSVFLMAVFAFSTSNAIAEKINLTDAYVEKNFVGNCLMLFSYKTNGYVKLEFKSKNRGIILTESGFILDAEISFPNGNLRTKHRNDVTSELYIENGKSYLRELGSTRTTKQPTHVGPCKTKFSDISSLPSLPSTSAPIASAPVVKVEKNEIAELEKKLAALKQKAGRKDEYLKMRSLLDQKLKEVQDQIRMLEQEYKDVLN